MQAKLGIAFGILLVIWVAFMTYRHFQQEEDTEAYVQDNYSRMTEAAQQTPVAGLPIMGMAIKNYHQDKNKYPATLGELFPDYIQDKSFIEEVPWQYATDQKGFRLAKTIGTRTAYVDHANLSPRMEGGKKVQVASSRKDKPAGQSERTSSARNTSAGRSAPTSYARLEPSEEREYSKDDLQKMKEKLIQELLSGKLSHGSYDLTESETMPMPAYFSAGKADALTANLGDQYLAWKGPNGALGFGNVMYPNLEQNLAYQSGEWFRTEQPPVSEETGNRPLDSALPEDITNKYGNTYLTWKDQNGRIGFGNVMYPEFQNYRVYQNGRWAGNKPPGTKLSESDDTWPPPTGMRYDPDRIVEKVDGTYLSWKNKDGSIGFGNVMYPRSRDLFIYQHGQWLQAKTEPPDTDTNDLADRGEYATSLGHANLVDKYKNSLYIWEGPAGTLGFGNVDYPQNDAVPLSHTSGTSGR